MAVQFGYRVPEERLKNASDNSAAPLGLGG